MLDSVMVVNVENVNGGNHQIIFNYQDIYIMFLFNYWGLKHCYGFKLNRTRFKMSMWPNAPDCLEIECLAGAELIL